MTMWPSGEKAVLKRAMIVASVLTQMMALACGGLVLDDSVLSGVGDALRWKLLGNSGGDGLGSPPASSAGLHRKRRRRPPIVWIAE
jgi:hypothetical protein